MKLYNIKNTIQENVTHDDLASIPDNSPTLYANYYGRYISKDEFIQNMKTGLYKAIERKDVFTAEPTQTIPDAYKTGWTQTCYATVFQLSLDHHSVKE